MPALTMSARGSGSLRVATPTATANQWAPSMQKHPGCRELVRIYGPEAYPEAFEQLMGWPIGWTACEPLATGRFRRWLLSHGAPSVPG